MKNADTYHLPLSVGETDERISEDRITELAQRSSNYLNILFRKAGLMDEEAHRPILRPDEHSYINHTISTTAHLIRYWIESPLVNMPPPETLTFVVEALRQAGIKLESAPQDVISDKQLFASLLNRAAISDSHTSRLDPQINKKAAVCARELVNLMPTLAAYNGHILPSDYSVEISMNIIAQNIAESENGEHGSFIVAAELKNILTGLEPDSSGYIRIDETRRLKLETLLKRSGIAVSPPTKELVQQGIELATTLVDQGKAREYLGSLPFIARENLQKSGGRPSALLLQHPIYINPEAITGANSFRDWTGRDEGNLKQDDMGDKKQSIEVIEDYATRGTPLKPSEISISVSEDGKLIIYAENSHRAAAAKLRSEPLAVDSILIYK